MTKGLQGRGSKAVCYLHKARRCHEWLAISRKVSRLEFMNWIDIYHCTCQAFHPDHSHPFSSLRTMKVASAASTAPSRVDPSPKGKAKAKSKSRARGKKNPVKSEWFHFFLLRAAACAKQKPHALGDWNSPRACFVNTFNFWIAFVCPCGSLWSKWFVLEGFAV